MATEPDHTSELPQAAVDYLWRGLTIETIKLIREELDIDLKEPKDLVDAYVRSQPTLQRKVEKAQEQLREKFVHRLIWFIILVVGERMPCLGPISRPVLHSR